MLHLWYSTIYTEGLSAEARFPRDRYRLVRDGLEALRKNGVLFFHEPEAIATEDLVLAHCPEFVQRFLSQELSEPEIRRIGLKPWTDMMVERSRILTQGTVSATQHVLQHGGVAGNIGGGTHHSYYDFGSGYCIFNDLAIAARVAQRDLGVERVLIIDLDVHQGDGTAAIFQNDKSVRTVSIHCQDNFPFRKQQSDVDRALPKGIGDAVYLAELTAQLEAERRQLERPQLILYQAGVDGLTTDRLGHLELTPEGISQRNRLIFQFAHEMDCPLVITMGGGYGEPIETSIEAHVDLFASAASR